MIPYRMNQLGISGLPYKRKLLYLQSTGTQWIDTGWYISDRSILTSYDMDTTFMFVQQHGNWEGICGYDCGQTGEKQYLTVQLGQQNSNTLILHNGDSTARVNISGILLGTQNHISYHYENNVTTYTINDYVTSLIDTILYFPLNLHYVLFCVTSNSWYVRQFYAWARIYSFRISVAGTPVRDFIPVLDYNNVPCMYDKVTRNMFYNQGTGQFLYA